MIYSLAKMFNQNPDYISINYDIDDYLLYESFEKRQGNIEKYFMNRNNDNGNNNHSENIVRKKVNSDDFIKMWEDKK